jgi:hypothetical protein
MQVLLQLLALIRALAADRARLATENLLLRQQVLVLRRSVKRVRLDESDRAFWVAARRWLGDWREHLVIVRPETVLRWHREAFRRFWRARSRPGVGRPPIGADVIALIRRISLENPLWGAPRVASELALLGHVVSDSTVAKYMTARRRGDVVRRRVAAIGMEELVSAKQSPWQNPFVERVIGSIRRECTDHVLPLWEGHLRRVLREYAAYYNAARCHLSLDRNAPEPRETESGPGAVRAVAHLGGLHHRYTRAA